MICLKHLIQFADLCPYCQYFTVITTSTTIPYPDQDNVAKGDKK